MSRSTLETTSPCSETNRMGFSRKRFYPTPLPVEDIDFFEVETLDFQSNLPWPWNFPFIMHPLFFLNFLFTSSPQQDFQQLLLYPLEFSIDILNRGCPIFSLEKPKHHREYSLLYFSGSRFKNYLNILTN